MSGKMRMKPKTICPDQNIAAHAMDILWRSMLYQSTRKRTRVISYLLFWPMDPFLHFQLMNPNNLQIQIWLDR
jgi:hypothetical protein